MMTFQAFLADQIRRGGASTEDVLVSFIPLVRQVIATHELGDVAPLEGVEQIQVDGAILGFPEPQSRAARQNHSTLRKLLRTRESAIEVIGESRVVADVHQGIEEQQDLLIAAAGEDINRPVYVRGYVCWEHLVGHHDPTTDVFSLGLILASLACGLNLADENDHQRFVTDRKNLFRVNPLLHPVLARSISVMTELDRNKRPQDLSGLLEALDNYRDQEVDFETDLASSNNLQKQDRSGKRKVILSKLQERLFEINRRNRLLQFRSTLHTINLTQASIPISFDVANIREKQVLTWNGSFRESIAKQKAVQLN